MNLELIKRKKIVKRKFLLGFLAMTMAMQLVGCATWSSDKKAYCRTLRSRIVFNGTTLNTRQQEIDRAEKPLQQNNYNDDCEN
jgi:CDGSH-type Zn-finger protein